MTPDQVEDIAQELIQIKNEEERIKVAKKKILDRITMPPAQKGTVTLKGVTQNIKITQSETVSYDQEDLLELLDDWEDFEDYFTISAKEKKREVDNLIKQGTPEGKALESIRQIKLSSPRISTSEVK